jgi:hypothetical protein
MLRFFSPDSVIRDGIEKGRVEGMGRTKSRGKDGGGWAKRGIKGRKRLSAMPRF